MKANEIKALQKIESLEIKNKIYLSTQNLQIICPSKKLDHKKIKPFIIIIKLGPAIRRLQLLKDAKIYLVFNVSLLHLVNPDTLLQSIF